MKLPPFWKIARELRRPFQQLRMLPSRMGTFLFGHHYYDCVLARQTRCRTGKLQAGSKVAIYLIFPQNGLLASHLTALRYLNSKGYATIVVSNIQLNEGEFGKLKDLCWQFIERPNFGYDFGGYRDGVMKVLETQSHIERLVLLNDSVWFPLPGSTDWLEQAEQRQLDFVGAASNFGHPRVDAKDFKSIQWSYSTSHKNFHYCSYALMFSERILSDVQFRNFWKRFPLTNNKKVTVRRGEIGLSQWVISHGFTHGSTLELDNLDREISALGEKEIRKAAEQTVIPERPRLLELKEHLLTNDASTQDLRDFILTAVSSQGVSYALPALMHEREGFAFLKKSPCWLNDRAYELTVDFAKGLDGELGPAILREAAQLRQQRKLDPVLHTARGEL
ncbi:rhamnan synthesis F family protein [Leisingera sp. S132]|uniref:rhamnan synthesis F family protein n=1 Tax=Leisingera sp. S132 TaxID=2867016 RepID=UPI0021A74A2C|nr:rhamnan synthesis F family protein [Leisingera sp. S132]UWQ79452.1 rhamnan synthesis F family protein [Leisingera sp. S132]